MIFCLLFLSRKNYWQELRRSVTASLWLLLVVPCHPAPSQADDPLAYLKSLSIEDLLETEVTSVSKKAEKLTDATAAAFVITSEDIRRAGARTIAEALRMAPGLQVSRVDANKWIVTSRGFSDTFSNKLLVLMDGRSVYSPLFSGVFWDVQDTLLEDIDRIEVIRGPGATLWGANAVNGVINIITKPAQQTQGALLTAGMGSYEDAEAGVRYGAKLDHADGAWRVYAKGFERGNFVTVHGDQESAAWKALRGGFRMDMDLGARDALTFQGDIYGGEKSQIVDLSETFPVVYPNPQTYPSEMFGANLLARWRRTCNAASEMAAQLYFDRTDRSEYLIEEVRDTLDLDFQHRFRPTSRQEILWGLGYRYTFDDSQTGIFSSITPASRADQLFSAFAQDEFTLQPDKWWLTIGSKFEHNDYTGYEIQPNLRLRWKPRPNQTAWAAVSRAVRTPSRGESGMRFDRIIQNANPPDQPYTISGAYWGNEDFGAETLTAYETGYRWQPTAPLSIDLAAFYNHYDNLRTIEPDFQAAFLETDPPPPHIVIPGYLDNNMSGETFGIELTTVWFPLPFWKLTANYSWLRMLLRSATRSLDIKGEAKEGLSPVNQIQLNSKLDLSRGWSFDTEIYYVDKLSGMDIPAYTRLDLRLGWQPAADWELSLNVENLLDNNHLEFIDSNDIIPARIPRRVYGQVTWRH